MLQATVPGIVKLQHITKIIIIWCEVDAMQAGNMCLKHLLGNKNFLQGVT